MPILRQHHVAEAAGQAIDGGHDFIATRNGKVAVGTEIVLDIDDQQDVAFSYRSRHGRAPAATPRGQGASAYDVKASRADALMHLAPAATPRGQGASEHPPGWP